MAVPATSLSDLPNEIIQQILFYIPPSSALATQRISRRFYDLTQPILWRYHCRTQFKYWDQKHNIQAKVADNVAKVDWKDVFSSRHSIDRATSHAIDAILACQISRVEKFQSIVGFGYDAKDTLLRHLNVDDDAEDVLARRYYSGVVLGCLHRTMAVEEWAKLKDSDSVSLERALAAYDMFVLHDRDGDFDDTTSRLDELAEHIRLEHPEVEEQSPRNKAYTIAAYLRRHNLIGIRSDPNYLDLQNNFIGIALQDEDHSSLPLISAAIYCCVAQRLGLDAQPCGFPFHVIAIVKPPEQGTLDGRARDSASPPESMYMDPFRSASEVPIKDLRAQLAAMGSDASNSAYLSASPTTEMVLRTSRNIMSSVRRAHGIARIANPHGGHPHLTTVSTFPELDSAFYAALWASLLLGSPAAGNGPATASLERRQFLPYIVRHFEAHFPNDVFLLEQHIVPLFQNLDEYRQFQETVREMRAGDTMQKQIKRRTTEVSKHVRYKVGQVFRHKRYRYMAVITGWDVECGASEPWIAQMQVHELARGRHQSFYHVLVEDRSVRYVAEENIEIITPEVPHSLMAFAGQHFKRWDRTTRSFVSNIRDEYPDD
ncbi:MAG: hypothetical protein FRX48_07404 [Lasallia pustulata]|uniref:F-box domain-containing protein n=1 Tax=Lasallia pustulata TaxID=136370 RepID=A0A5M8PJH5_9LECA|nr:MAG: hypothetical protein FRX48_07404 [Lasallia pustulata]